MLLRRGFAVTVLAAALCAPAAAQNAPGPPPPTGGPARAVRSPLQGATFALRAAYQAIADAQTRGASALLDAAKSHYRSAVARFGRQDPGAAGEAEAASALARAAIAEHPVPPPRDIPSPPSAPDVTMLRPPMMSPPMMSPPMMAPPMMRERHGRRGGRFDPARLGADAKLVNTPEAQTLAQRALDADIARTRAAFAGNDDEAMREGRLANALARAVHALALADHPPMPQRRSLPVEPRVRGDGIVGSTENEPTDDD